MFIRLKTLLLKDMGTPTHILHKNVFHIKLDV